jgi:uncharacterized protein (TIGR03067 family)
MYRKAAPAEILVAFVLTTAAAAGGQGPPAIAAALQGTWTVESVNGTKLDSLGQKTTMTFSKNTYSVTTNGQVRERGTFTIDERRKPAEIDMKIGEGVAVGSTQLGLVEIANGVLRLKTNSVGTPKRPTDFKSEPWYTSIVARKS